MEMLGLLQRRTKHLIRYERRVFIVSRFEEI